MKLHFLGTGTSIGVPQMGCSCSVCCSEDARDKRLRCSALIETDDQRLILIDCGPDFGGRCCDLWQNILTRKALPFPILCAK